MEEERICTHCGEVISEGEGTSVSGDLLCDECVEELCITCEHCTEVIYSDDCITDDHTWLCQDCYDDYYRRCPAIITPEEFEKVQQKMKNRSDARCNYSTKHYYPLNGKVWNDDGTVRFSGSVNHSSGKKYYQYRCTKPGNKSVNADSLEEAVFFALRELLMSDDKSDKLIEKLNSYAENVHEQFGKEYTKMKNKKVALTNRLNNMIDRIESGKAPKSVMNRIKELEDEINQLDCQMKQADTEAHVFSQDDFCEIKKQFIPYMKEQNTLEAKELMNSTIDKVMTGQDIIDIKFRNGIEAQKNTMEFFE